MDPLGVHQNESINGHRSQFPLEKITPKYRTQNYYRHFILIFVWFLLHSFIIPHFRLPWQHPLDPHFFGFLPAPIIPIQAPHSTVRDVSAREAMMGKAGAAGTSGTAPAIHIDRVWN